MEEMKDWGEDGVQAGEGGGERNELGGGDVGRVDGAQKMGFGRHGYHSFHSQFKYVRPGAAPIPGAGPAAVGRALGQVCPPGGLLPFAGRGRGEWQETIKRLKKLMVRLTIHCLLLEGIEKITTVRIVSSRGNTEERASDQNPMTRKSLKKYKGKENVSSEDEEQQDSRKAHNGPSTKLPEESIKPQENIEKSKSLLEEKNEDAKPLEDKHLDTVEKLKKRNERFKLPMPIEKEALAVKKIENEPLVSALPETRPESEVKPERPARKRRLTSG
ncbi:hypothetical protein M8C21_020329 [Ambrosia artemisiifolia]|uniref:Uncharacterized protein n=1 Tax=Ambrosia artemisiifolia TaxID=4212 RepID=A0AAD5G789_AMBAR|nr:hypothetical protein M8C21_020329 [Ambrosia artemisiifolia]